MKHINILNKKKRQVRRERRKVSSIDIYLSFVLNKTFK